MASTPSNFFSGANTSSHLVSESGGNSAGKPSRTKEVEPQTTICKLFKCYASALEPKVEHICCLWQNDKSKDASCFFVCSLAQKPKRFTSTLCIC